MSRKLEVLYILDGLAGCAGPGSILIVCFGVVLGGDRVRVRDSGDLGDRGGVCVEM